MLLALDAVRKKEGGSNFSDLLLLNLMNLSIYSYITAFEVGLCVIITFDKKTAWAFDVVTMIMFIDHKLDIK